ncbi:MAG: DUF4197 family protein [Syntrophotaleaceae bacterium]
MNRRTAILAASLVALLLWSAPPTSQAAWGNIFEGVRNLIGGGSLQNEDIIAGLKEALRIGAGNSVTQVGQDGGYLNNPSIRIPCRRRWPGR